MHLLTNAISNDENNNLKLDCLEWPKTIWNLPSNVFGEQKCGIYRQNFLSEL